MSDVVVGHDEVGLGHVGRELVEGHRRIGDDQVNVEVHQIAARAMQGAPHGPRLEPRRPLALRVPLRDKLRLVTGHAASKRRAASGGASAKKVEEGRRERQTAAAAAAAAVA